MQMTLYNDLFSKHAHKSGMKSNVVAAIRSRTLVLYPEWFLEAGEFSEHRDKFLDFLVTVLLFKNSKWQARHTVGAKN